MYRVEFLVHLPNFFSFIFVNYTTDVTCVVGWGVPQMNLVTKVTLVTECKVIVVIRVAVASKVIRVTKINIAYPIVTCCIKYSSLRKSVQMFALS
jgi:hypothetical protein